MKGIRLPFLISFFFFCSLSMGADRIVVLQSSEIMPFLSEHALDRSNVKYIVKSKYNLNGKTFKLKKESSIEFDGGQFCNGILYLESNTLLDGLSSAEERGKGLKIQIGGENVRINNLKWSNDRGVALLSYATCNNLSINNCNITSTTDNSIKVVADNIKGIISGILIKSSTFTYKRMGIEIQNHGNNDYKYDGLIIQGCNFVMTDSSSKYGYAVSLSGYGKNVMISNNSFSGNKVGVELVGFSDVTITNNKFQNIISKPLVCSNKRRMNNVLVENNEINCPSAKIQISNTDRLILKNNNIIINYIELIGCCDCVISNNDIASRGHYALILDGGAKRCTNNLIYDNSIRQEGDNWAIIRCYGTHCSENQVKDNRISRISKRGKTLDQIKGANNNVIK